LRKIVLIAVLATAVTLRGQSNSSIRGVVLEGDTDRPLSGVSVTAAGPTTRTAVTDAQGHFELDVREAGRYRVTPAREGMAYSRPSRLHEPQEPGVWVQIAASQNQDNVILRMVPAAVITGKVLDVDGKPYPALRGSVSLMRYTYDENGNRQLATIPWILYGTNVVARMDDQGTYRIYGLQPGDYYVSGGGGGSHYFYPGTPNKDAAKPVHVNAGDELHLETIVLPAQKSLAVHFLFSGPDGNALMVGPSNLMLITNDGGGFIALSGISRPETQVPALADRTFSLVSGHYEFMVGLIGRPSSPGLVGDILFGPADINLGSTEMDIPVKMAPGLRVTGSISILDSAGKETGTAGLYCKLNSNGAHIESTGASSSNTGCLGSQFSAGAYQLEMTGMPPDAYVESTLANGKDIFANGLLLNADTELKIVIRTMGSTLDGEVKDSAGQRISDAIVALVPDAPLRAGGPLYRSGVSDINGKYQLRGIAPGAYHLFAWSELEGAAYRNADFLKDFEARGKPTQIEKNSHSSLDLTALN